MVTVVTGASGFLGGVLVREPLARGQASELSTYGVGGFGGSQRRVGAGRRSRPGKSSAGDGGG